MKRIIIFKHSILYLAGLFLLTPSMLAFSETAIDNQRNIRYQQIIEPIIRQRLQYNNAIATFIVGDNNEISAIQHDYNNSILTGQVGNNNSQNIEQFNNFNTAITIQEGDYLSLDLTQSGYSFAKILQTGSNQALDIDLAPWHSIIIE